MSALRQAVPSSSGRQAYQLSRLKLLQWDRELDGFDRALLSSRIHRYGSDPLMAWAIRYLSHQMRFQDGPHRGEFCAPSLHHQALTAAIYALLTSEEPSPALAGLLFRGFGKTTYGTTATVLWAITECYKKNVILVCASKEEAADRIRSIVEELEGNEQLRAAYHELAWAKDLKNQTKSYTDYQIILAGGARIKAYAFGGKLRGSNWHGSRPDLIILDDPEDDDFAYSKIKRERGWRWLQAVVLRALSKYGAVLWLGTPVSRDSLLLRSRRSGSEPDNPGLGWDGPFVPIAEEVRGSDGASAPVLQLKPAWPAMHSEADVARMLATGDRGIARQELMLEPLDLSDNPFDIAWYDDHTYDASGLKFINGSWEWFGQRLSRMRIQIDSASSTLDSADRTAIGVAALAPNGDCLVLEVVYGQYKPTQQLAILRELYARWKPERIGAQKTQIEEGLADFASEGAFMPWELEAVSNAAGAKDRRIRNSTVYYSSGKVRFAGGDPRQRAVREEMKTYPAGHDDALDMMERLLNKQLGEAPSAGGIEACGERESAEGLSGW